MQQATLSASRRRNQVVILRDLSLVKKSAMVGSSAFFAGNFGRNAWRSEKSAYLCSDFHLNKATASPTVSAVGYFYSRGSNPISSVPCGALMRPLPCSRCSATGSGTFFVSVLKAIINTFRFISTHYTK